MKNIYDIFIKCVKNRDYESVAWILNYVDPKALHDLICEINPSSNIDSGSIIIWQTKNEFIAIYWDISSGYITISVKYSKDTNNPLISLMKCLYPKFKNIILSIEQKSSPDSFSINRCCPLENCIYSESSAETDL